MITGTTAPTLSCVEFNPSIPAQAAVIWLHGLGADGHDFEPIAPLLQSQLTVPTRFVFPHAPHRPITINGGYSMRAWYDIAALDLSHTEDADGIYASARQLHALIQREIDNGIAARRIVLAGVALSTYLPLVATLSEERDPANFETPIFMAHGDEDTIVLLAHASVSKQYLQELGYTLEWHSYRMPHSICDAEVADISAWLGQVLQG